MIVTLPKLMVGGRFKPGEDGDVGQGDSTFRYRSSVIIKSGFGKVRQGDAVGEGSRVYEGGLWCRLGQHTIVVEKKGFAD